MCRRRTTSPCPRPATRRSSWSGPGTGVAPFRAFLHERMATKRAGPVVAVLRPPARSARFLLRRRVGDDAAEGRAHQLSTRLVARRCAEDLCAAAHPREPAPSSSGGLSSGAHFYVCGDAKKMAKDVETAVRDVAAAHGGMSAEAAAAYVAKLKADRALPGRRLLITRLQSPSYSGFREAPMAFSEVGRAPARVLVTFPGPR